ncbi:MAG: heme ABC transporter ATP-binding protein [Hyphomicrobiales bacterium]|nr:heme ABC transporter ATP-binding protein [Hyphomicrobiales bacterium]
MTTPALEASSVSVFAAGGRALLADVSLALVPGEVVALVGPNGAGKSTLLRVLSGDLSPQRGHVMLDGRSLRAYRPRALAQRRAVLAQSINVVFPFTVTDIVRMGAGDDHGRRVDHLVEAVLAEVDLIGFESRVITTLSGGEQQRAHLARVLVQLDCAMSGPGILLLDEPTASLDLRHQLDVLAAIGRRAGHGAAVLIVLHDLNLAARLAGHVVVMKGGHIDADGTPHETITGDVLARVFAVTEVVCQVPPASVPFVLPHAARKL